MINIVLIGKERITGSVAGVPFNVDYTKAKYKAMAAIEVSVANVKTMDEMNALIEQFKPLLVESVKAKIESAIDNIYVDEKTNEFFLYHNKVMSSVAIPQVLVDDMMYCLENDLPVTPIVKYWARLLRNPNIRSKSSATAWADLICRYTTLTFVSEPLKESLMEEGGYSEAIATEMATVRQTPFTMEGLISCKKVVNPLMDRTNYKFILDDEGNPKKVLRNSGTKTINEDTGEVTTEGSGPQFAEEWQFEPGVVGSGHEAFHCGDEGLGHVYKVGKEAYFESFDSVNCDHNASCVKGLHLGNQNYINSWETDSNMTLNCFVDPMDIGAVAGGDDVMRVKAFFPHSIKSRETDNKYLYHSSTYASKKDIEWSTFIAEAAKKFAVTQADAIAKADEEQNELASL